ncbi:Uncharacterized protein Fot_03667 [Forsythia ovata]|uniref:Uncharacterized protein n=1 Tax=Forsythia ovata TaxID=205694 RepID=A0ABD1XAC1_9LAMI
MGLMQVTQEKGNPSFSIPKSHNSSISLSFSPPPPKILLCLIEVDLFVGVQKTSSNERDKHVFLNLAQSNKLFPVVPEQNFPKSRLEVEHIKSTEIQKQSTLYGFDFLDLVLMEPGWMITKVSRVVRKAFWPILTGKKEKFSRTHA